MPFGSDRAHFHLRGVPIHPRGRGRPSRMAERTTHSIPVTEFASDRDSFDDWITLFEDAVVLATNAPVDRRADLFKKWLPLKLDTRARDLYKNCDTTAAWDAIKTQLKGLLVDPQEKYNWQIHRNWTMQTCQGSKDQLYGIFKLRLKDCSQNPLLTIAIHKSTFQRIWQRQHM